MKQRNISLLFFAWMMMLLIQGCASSKNGANNNTTWLGSWSTAPQLVEPHNMPPEPGLSQNTIRQIVRVSVGGETLRLKLSNAFSTQPVEIKQVAVANSIQGSRVDLSSQKIVKFNDKAEAILEPGGELFSDPFQFNLKPGSRLAITIYFGETSPDVTGHPGSRTTSFILTGNNIDSPDFAESTPTDHWYIINSLEVMADKTAGAIAIMGNSITDGRGSGTNKQNRWPDILSQRLLNNPSTSQVGVLNMGIGGNCVLRGGLGPTALARFDRDILSQSNVRWLIILEGINDIGGIQTEEDAIKIARELIEAYEEMISKARAEGIKVYGATILPFAKSFYDSEHRQAARDKVNDWIRNSGRFDAVIDFDEVMRDPSDIKTILPDMHDNDFLHPNEAGYERMGESIDLNLFQ